MDETRNALEDDVSAVFERACNEQDLAVAEHLLRALELIAQRDERQTERLQRALLRLARNAATALAHFLNDSPADGTGDWRIRLDGEFMDQLASAQRYQYQNARYDRKISGRPGRQSLLNLGLEATKIDRTTTDAM